MSTVNTDATVDLTKRLALVTLNAHTHNIVRPALNTKRELQKKAYPKANTRWTGDDDDKLAGMFRDRADDDVMVTELQRPIKGISFHLQKILATMLQQDPKYQEAIENLARAFHRPVGDIAKALYVDHGGACLKRVPRLRA